MGSDCALMFMFCVNTVDPSDSCMRLMLTGLEANTLNVARLQSSWAELEALT